MYASDFWVMTRDLTLLNEEHLNKIAEGNLTIDESTSLKFDGNLTLSYSNLPINYFKYQH